MKKTLFLTACLLSSLAVAQAATIDLLSSIAGTDPANVSPSTAFQSATVDGDYIATWLSGQSDGIYSTVGNNNITDVSIVNPSLTSASEDYTLSFTNRTRYAGSVVGLVSTVDVEDLSTVTDLTLSYTATSGVSGTLYLVYQVSEGSWEMLSTSFSVSTAATLTADLSSTGLYSSTVYAVVRTTDGAGTSQTGAISLTAATSAVPEPATASLSLLGLGALLLRRRRH